MSTFLRETQSNGCEYFVNTSHSSKEFYSSLEAALNKHDAPDVSYSRVSLSEGGIFSQNREYLRITRKGLSIDICAAPFASGFFVSSWVGEQGSIVIDLLSQIPILGPIIAKTKIKNKTYFQADTEAMFKLFVNEAIREVSEKMSNTKGQRADSTQS